MIMKLIFLIIQKKRPDNIVKKAAYFFLIIIVITFMKPYVVMADISGRADANYYKTTTTTAGQTTESTSLNQGYSLGLTHQLTSTIMISGDVRWSINEANGRQTEDVYPVFFLNYVPPSMYYLSFSYNRSENLPPGGDRIATSTTNASFSLPVEGWPSISLTYSRTATEDFLTIHKTNNVSTNKGFNTAYGFNFLETETSLNYSYTNSTTEDKVANTTAETQNHSASTNFSRAFWDKMIQTNASVGYSQSKRIDKSLGSPIRFEDKFTASDGLYSIDTTPTVDFLTSTPALIDNNTGASAGIDLNNSYRNMGFKFTTAQSIQKIHLYISTSDTNIATYVSNSSTYFGWQLYTSSDGTNWTLRGISTVSYEAANLRIVFTFPEFNALYFKIVNTAFPAAALPISVTEIEAIGFKTSTPTNVLTAKSTSNFGSFNISFTPVERLNMNYNINYNHGAEDINDSDTTSINQGAHMGLIVVPEYLTLSTGYATATASATQKTSSTSTTYTTTKTGADTYTMTLSSTPLSTVGMGLNYGHSESLTDSETTSKADSMAGNISMKLYKGIDLGIGSSMSESKEIKSNAKTSSQSYYGNLNLIPWNALSMAVNGGISTSTSESGGIKTSSSSNSLSTNFSYAPTRNLYVSASITIEPAVSQSYSISWLPTRRIQTGIRYGLSGDTTNMGADLSWAPISRLSLRLGYTGTRMGNATNDQADSVFASVALTL
ncbi:MAG: hypothetical protein A3G39_04500 [Deltaproteobacteria bacterium RIFCSPLOWO2_12_FULL_43_16]|nr:MAG: hypothetical protein A3D30_09515 [Deltaproteobacteria bacterium RIFCSPHIGHO2_02_FULL_43_33]OGQ61276.1 MAG: hypothetical protein A3G39_04500 [Deltaproteobacteria bacterium RIFCSPLOWO2_12_FULL_43_16]HBR16771.1 hypothetical protein [Deltaproteobacteria bacterium]